MAIKCPKCQTDNPDTLKFCGECGTQLTPSKDPYLSKTMTLKTPAEGLTRGALFAGRYEIIKEVGQGGMGKVYRAMDTEVKEEVALKLIRSEIAQDESAIERFRNELKVARKISHRNVCRMHDLGTAKEGYYITMEYVEGENLKSYIKRNGKLPASDVISLAKQVCDGLREAHELGVIHRDMKPQNIMIDKTGQVKIMDFGIARSVDAAGVTQTGVMIGTPDYISPEQAEGEPADQRSDIYSLGVILYEMVTGSLPFKGDTALSVALKHKSQLPLDPKKINPDVSDDLARLILICMEKDRERRYQTAEALLDDLRNIEEEFPLGTKMRPRRATFVSTLIRKKLFIPALVVFLAIIAVLTWQLLPRIMEGPISSEKPSIAVLAFDDISELKDQEHFCEGLAVTLISKLTHIENLHVPARSSAFLFKGKEKNYKEIGEQLNVRFVLDGSIQKSGDQRRIGAQIINCSDGSIIWDDLYDEEEKDIFDIQDQIAQEIVDNLKIELLGREKEELTKRYTDNRDAYILYLQGRYFWEKRTKEDMRKSLECFEKAIEIDPDYALAYTGIADSYLIRAGSLLDVSPEAAYERARKAAERALEIDESLAEAHDVLAIVLFEYDWDWPAAERESKRAIELNPGLVYPHLGYSLFLATQARFDEAIAQAQRACEIDPLSWIARMYLGVMLYYSRDYDKAIQQLESTLELKSDLARARYWLGRAYVQKGMFDPAEAEFQKAIDYSQGASEYVAALGYAYAVAGKEDEAKNVLERLDVLSHDTIVTSLPLAMIHAALGERERALDLIESGVEEREEKAAYLKADPAFDSLRSEPRFTEILRKIGLEKLPR